MANRRFKQIRANRSNVMKIEVFLRIDSHESPDSRFESPGHLSPSFYGILGAIFFARREGRGVEKCGPRGMLHNGELHAGPCGSGL